MTTPSLVKDLFDRPQAVRKGDFVLQLAASVEAPKSTVESYVVTPAIADALDQALGLVGSALGDGRSKAAYVHGSFGSGKSHFMAMLSLLLRNDEHAWRVPELHALRDKHRFVEKAKLLELHFHMIDKVSLEAALFETYVGFIKEHHPKAPIPALFADEELFENARTMLDQMGEGPFFQRMGGGGSADEWGEFAASDGAWNRARFEACATSTSPKARRELFDALVKSWFSAYTSAGSFVDIDSGIAEMSRHAGELGYTGIVLFLDELILWLSHRASEHAWLHAQVQKMVKLVEAQEASRAVPVVSFIARQRDLADMVGADYAGAESTLLRGSLEHWSGRFDTIKLEDRNLPAIVERRVLKPRPGAEAEIDRAFDELRRKAGGAWNTLLGEQDAAAFRKLYPFSPALVEALVGLSSFLQRERTAIRLLMELLVAHMEDLKVGQVVCVGDLFDALADGTDAADGSMRMRFAAARDLYQRSILPMLQAQHGTDTPARCQRQRTEHPVRLGCANCPESQCRSDNRLLKTLLVAALVPEVRALKDLTASRLVALNHGSIRVPVQGTESKQATQKLERWQAGPLTQVHVGREKDPIIRLQLEGVDLTDILRRAAELDSLPARQRTLRNLLFTALGLDAVNDPTKDYAVEWRGTKRRGHVVFGNVRKFSLEQLRCPDDYDFRFVVDYPFDEPEFGPRDDEQVLEQVIEKGGAGWTLVWLPSFFSSATNTLLAELTILEGILETPLSTQRHIAHLAVEQQARVRVDLENLRNAKRGRLTQVLDQAYGLARAQEGDLDAGLTVERHLVTLKPGARVMPAQASALSNALDVYLPALLDARYPRHPKFTRQLRTKKFAEELVSTFGQLVDSDDKQLGRDKGQLEDLRGTLGELGIVRITERAVFLAETGLLHALENRRRKEELDKPSVRQIRTWIDEDARMGLQEDAEDVILRCYARLFARTFVHFDRPYEPRAGLTMPDDVVLEQPPLPSHDEWQKALNLVGAAFGITLPGKALHADNVKRFEQALKDKLGSVAQAAARLPGLLRDWAEEHGVDARADRLQTADSADALCAQLAGKSGKAAVETLAAFEARTSAKALGQSLATANDTRAVLDDALVRGAFQQLRARAATTMGADELLARVQGALRQDELHVSLAERVRKAAVEAQALLRPVAGPTAGKRRVAGESFDGVGTAEASRKLRALAERLEKEPGLAVTGLVELWTNAREGES